MAKDFNALTNNLETLIKQVNLPSQKFLRASAIASGNQELVYGVHASQPEDGLDIVDPIDGVTNFMIGTDRLGSPSKTVR